MAYLLISINKLKPIPAVRLYGIYYDKQKVQSALDFNEKYSRSFGDEEVEFRIIDVPF